MVGPGLEAAPLSTAVGMVRRAVAEEATRQGAMLALDMVCGVCGKLESGEQGAGCVCGVYGAVVQG